MTALLASVLAAFAEAWLSSRLKGVRVKIDKEKLQGLLEGSLDQFSRRESKFKKLSKKEETILGKLKQIRPIPQPGVIARNTKGELGLIENVNGFGVIKGIQLGSPDSKAVGGPWEARVGEVFVVAHVETLD